MGCDVLDLGEIDRTRAPLAGGKGANLGELTGVEGVRVPPGFCVTTDAYRRIVAEAPGIDARVGRLARLAPDDREGIRALAAEIRLAIEAIAIPDDLAAAVAAALGRAGDGEARWAVRSSATAEDLPTASFAGQHDSHLDVAGPAVLDGVRRCWASLFTERAVSYRLRNGVDHRAVRMAVVVQRMVAAEAAGVLFTADPVTGNRRVAVIEAVPGLGEALVSGLAAADAYRVRDGAIVERAIAAERDADAGAPGARPALADAQVVRLAALGRRIERHFGAPQDVEWCLAGDDFLIVQSRPITTLFPVPEAGDGEPHVYVSVGHQQMMTDPLTPLGLSVWQLTTPRPMAEAGGRLFVDVAPMLASPASRESLVSMLGRSDPLIGDALRTVVERGFVPERPDDAPAWTPPGATPPGAPPIETDPAIVAELIEEGRASLAAVEREVGARSGEALLDFIVADLGQLRQIPTHPRSMQVIMAGMEAAWWLNDRLAEWLGERNAADPLTQSVPNNVTSEMGLALLDVGDAIRPHPEVVAFLQAVHDDDFLDRLPALPGGQEARDAIAGWLDAYGMRGAGEIDVTRPRWSERPSLLLPILLGHVRSFAPGEAARRFERRLQEARRKEREVLDRLRALPDGERKAEETKRMIDRVRTFAGYREHPKYRMVGRYFVYKRALMAEADRLVRAGALRDREDVFFLRFEELREAVRTGRVDERSIAERREAFRAHHALTPPRVMTSEGEAIAGAYRRDGVPAGALVGLPVSAGRVEGRARVVLDMAAADLEPGDILVTAYTDPSWTPLFVTIAGLVTEVGGLMTHGAVIAREYGLPALVGVERATRLIRDGQRIRVHGTDGYVELLD